MPSYETGAGDPDELFADDLNGGEDEELFAEDVEDEISMIRSAVGDIRAEYDLSEEQDGHLKRAVSELNAAVAVDKADEE